VAHEFNNLLAVVLGYSELALNRIGETEPLQRYLEEMQKAARRGAGLTEQILAFARRQLVSPQLLDLNRLVADVAAMTAPLLGEHVHLSTSLEPLLGAARADPRQLELVLVNLLLNARDAMPDGGQVLMRTANVDLDPAAARRSRELQPGSYVSISVGDTGVGIAPEHLVRVFEPFFTTKEVGQGTGLGLATAYGIVRQSGGDLTVESQPGCGATFTVYLPRATAAG
jgi:signal transduction histidine kinase